MDQELGTNQDALRRHSGNGIGGWTKINSDGRAASWLCLISLETQHRIIKPKSLVICLSVINLSRLVGANRFRPLHIWNI
ncbi:hypothetical protein [Sphingobacterium mizutaii]|uniref:hypothetical protein n=1 Tax=Sphingobacterium mizutaii TaxID=1010 RepID=UPI00162723AC|nr:hypothetical protein [Sphingobacterium mizutaii]